MAKKTATSAPEPSGKICPKHNIPLVRHKRKWYCMECLRASAIIHESQTDAQRRWRGSTEGKEALRRYEQSPKGQKARTTYLKSDKYKSRRKEYNQRLQEALREARKVRQRAVSIEPALTKQKLESLIRDIKDYMSWGRQPTAEEVLKWASEYGIQVKTGEVQALIQKAKEL